MAAMHDPTAPRRKAPPRRLPLWYFAIGHGCLLGGLAVAALDPGSISGFFFHPRMFGVVHLVTLGWITHSILGATYLAAPLALRADLVARRADGWACAFVAIGASGVIAHFFIDEYSGVAYSGGTLLLAFVYVAVRVWRALAGAGTDRPVKWLVGCAYANLLLTAILGTLLSINKHRHFLPGNHLESVYGHAMLGLLGWGVMILVGVGLRMLPMFLPARPPSEKSAWALVILLQGGLLLLVASYLFDPSWARFAAVVPALGIAWFLALFTRMLKHRLPAAKAMRRPDLGMLHAVQAIAYLAISTVTGLVVVFRADFAHGLVMAFGVFALLGFLGQVILGVQMRLLPMNAWLQAWTASGYTERPPSPHALPVRPLQALSFACWTAGVPVLAWGLSQPDDVVVSWGAWLLIGGTLSATASTWAVLRRATTSSPTPTRA